MADSTNPADLPPGMDAYAGYDNGHWPDFQAIAAAHGSAHLLDLSVFFANAGTGLDIEPGDADPDQAAPYVAERIAAGVQRPVVYCSWSDLGAVAASLDATGRWTYRILSAHYDAEYGAHICSPSVCGAAVQCDGTQWIDHGSWDESLLADDFFDLPSAAGPPPAPKPLPPPPPPQETEMIAPSHTGNGYFIAHPDGSVFAFGDASYEGGCNAGAPGHAASLLSNGEVVTSIASHPTAQGYWLHSSAGHVFAFGAAAFHGNA